MDKLNTSPASGMRDFLSSAVLKRKYAISIIENIYELYGFSPLETPTMERLDVLTGKYGDEGESLIFKVMKRGEKLNNELLSDKPELADLALKYDLTVPLARVVSKYKEQLGSLYKRYQIQPVYRADRPAKGRYREFYQCDVDIVGSESLVCEAEVLNAGSHVLKTLGFNNDSNSFTIRLNHRGVLEGILEYSNIDKSDHSQALVTIDKLDKIGINGVIIELKSKGLEEAQIEKLASFFIDYDNSGMISFLKNHLESSAVGIKAVEEIELLLEYLENGLAYSHIKIDPSIARGLSYYTGIIFEVEIEGFNGSCASGGRYDELIGMFLENNIPACGFSLGLERILLIMEDKNMFPENLDKMVDVLTIVPTEKTTPTALMLTKQLRENNIRCEVYPRFDKLSKQFKYASNKNIPFVLILGEDELNENKVSIKNMSSGTQEKVDQDMLVSYFKETLNNKH